MSIVPDPKLVEQARQVGAAIEKHSEQAERDGRLPRAVFDALHEAGFTRLYVPRSLGGLEADPVTVAAVSSEIARHDASAAWAIMVSNQSAFTSGSFSDSVVEEVYAGKGHVAGVIAPPFEATPVSGGYKLSGRRAFASTIRDASWFFCTGFAMKTNGPPDFFGAIIPKSEVRIHETWGGALGMRATDSQDVELAGVHVPSARTFSFTKEPAPNKHFRGPLYRYPVAGACVTAVIAPVALGVAESAVQEMRAVCAQKTAFGSQTKLMDRTDTQLKLGRAEGLVRSARAYLLDALGRAGEKNAAGIPTTMEDKAGLVLAGAHVAQTSAEAVDLVYAATGTNGILAGRKLNKLVRDANVLRQHGFTSESRFATAGQMLFGLPPDVPLLAA